MPASLETAIASFQTSSKNNPFSTWFIHDYPEDIAKTVSGSNHSLLKNQVCTLKNFAKLVVKTARPKQVVLSQDNELIKFEEIASQSPLKKGDIPLPLGLISEIRSVYTFTSYYNVTIPHNTEKHKIIADIIAEYKNWCTKNDVLDSMTVLKEAANILRNREFPAEMLIFSPTIKRNPLMQDLYDSLSSYPHVEFQREDSKNDLEISCRKYHTAKSEITATLDKIAELLESGVKPEDILILSPSSPGTEEAILEYAQDFYATIDGTPRPLQFSFLDSGPSLSTFPVITSLTSVLSAVTNDYQTRDLETILSSRYFPNLKPEKLTAGALHLISTISDGNEGKEFLLSLESRLKKGSGYCHFKNEIPEVKEFVRWIERLENAGTTYGEITNALLSWLIASGWRTAATDELNGKARIALLRYLYQLQKSAVAQEPCTLSGYAAMIDRFVTQTILKPWSKNGIRVASLRSASYDSADYVFIVGMTAEAIPNVTPTLPPFTEKETDELVPDLKKDMFERETEHMKKALRSAGKELVLSYPEKQRGRCYSPSSFLTSEEPVQIVNDPDLTHSISRNQITAGKLLRENGTLPETLVGLTDGEDVFRRAETLQTGKLYSYDLSNSPDYLRQQENLKSAPTVIETYLECPLEWLLSRHMKLYTPFDDSREGTKVGNAIHAALKRFFQEFTEPVTYDNINEAHDCLFRLAEEELDKMNISSSSWDAAKKQYLGRDGLNSPLDALLKKEVEWQKEGWKTDGTMVEFGLDMDINLNGETVHIKGSIDRILEHENEYKILDYKNGSTFTYDHNTTIQIPLYAEAYRQTMDDKGKTRKPVDGVYLKMDASAKNKLQEIRVTKRTENNHREELKFETVIQEAMNNCSAAIAGMKRGKCNPPVKCQNKYCNFKLLCNRMGAIKEDEE